MPADSKPGRAVSRDSGQPPWVIDALPPQYADIAGRIAELQQEAAKFERVAAVLWQTGRPLVQAVHDLFEAVELETTLAADSASHDVSVQLEGSRRLLVQVMGGAGAIDRKDPVIARALSALQQEAGPGDRVVVVCNVFCDKAPEARQQEPAAPDALRLIQGLGANLVTTPTLFGLWRYSLTDLPSARKSVHMLHGLDGGIFR
jgi:hypothetical protein